MVLSLARKGGFFVLGVEGGIHRELGAHWWVDAGLFLGGGGGRSSLVGGGAMIRPHVGIAYEFPWLRLGVHYSYINFPTGEIRSQQIGASIDIPFDFYYVSAKDGSPCYLFDWDDIGLFNGNFLSLQRNDFSIIFQAYNQRSGTKNVFGQTQDGTIGLIGAELDHYITDNTFWWVKTSGAYAGVPNGYMDILGGFGYHWTPFSSGIAIVPQMGVGAGGGGNVDTGGGVLVQPQIGVEVPFSSHFSGRLSGGYLWAPAGELSAYTATGAIIYHLDIATASDKPLTRLAERLSVQTWRLQLFNQTYLHPQRASNNIRSDINMVGVQIDQYITPYFFFVYQAASAYEGNHAGGLASGMIGPGLQSPHFFNKRVQAFGELLIGAAGGGGLALGGGAIIEPVAGLHFSFTESIGGEVSVSQIKALRHDLDTTVINFGLTARFGTLNRE